MTEIDTDDLGSIDGGNRPAPGECYWYDIGVSADAMVNGGFFQWLASPFCP